jgi:hypothetical protein
MNAFFEGFEKRASLAHRRVGLQKEATPLIAPAVHGVQNLIGHKAIRSKMFANSISKNFQEGLAGKPESRLKAFGRGLFGGAVLPEISALQSHARDAGESLSKGIEATGKKKMGFKDRVVLDNVLKGNFSRVGKHLNKKNPVHQAAGDAIKKKTGIDIFNKQNYSDMEKAWKSKDSPLTSNILSNAMSAPAPKMTAADLKRKAAGAPVTRHGYEYAGNIAGAAPLAIADPITAGMNAFKATTTNKKVRELAKKVPVFKKGLDTVDKTFVTNPVSNAFLSGQRQEKPNKFKEGFATYVINPVTGSAQTSARMFGQAAGAAQGRS